MVTVTPKGITVPMDYLSSSIQADAYAAGYAAGQAALTFQELVERDYAAEIAAADAEATPGAVFVTAHYTNIVTETKFLASAGYQTGLEVIAFDVVPKPGSLGGLIAPAAKGCHLDCNPTTTKLWTGSPAP